MGAGIRRGHGEMEWRLGTGIAGLAEGLYIRSSELGARKEMVLGVGGLVLGVQKRAVERGWALH